MMKTVAAAAICRVLCWHVSQALRVHTFHMIPLLSLNPSHDVMSALCAQHVCLAVTLCVYVSSQIFSMCASAVTLCVSVSTQIFSLSWRSYYGVPYQVQDDFDCLHLRSRRYTVPISSSPRNDANSVFEVIFENIWM